MGTEKGWAMQKLAEALEARKGEDSLRAVAGQIGVAPGTVEGWLKGWRQPSYKHLRPLAEYLNEDIDLIVRWLIEDENPEAPIIHGLSRVAWSARPIDIPVAA